MLHVQPAPTGGFRITDDLRVALGEYQAKVLSGNPHSLYGAGSGGRGSNPRRPA
jgi:hypothetical protein